MRNSETKNRKFLLEAEVEKPYVKNEIINVSRCAKTKEDAIEEYRNELCSQGKTVIGISKRVSPLCGIIFLSITFVMSLFRYYETDGFKYLELYPNIISLMISLVIYSAFVIRVKGIENVFKNFSDSLISLLFILVMGIFINIFTGESTVPTGIIGKFLAKIGFGNSYILICSAIVLSWLGLKQVCGFVWIAVIAFGLAELVTCGNYIGNYKGSIFILSAFLGCIFYLKYEGKLILNSFKRLSIYTVNRLDSDIQESQKFVRNKINSGITKEEIKTIEDKNANN